MKTNHIESSKISIKVLARFAKKFEVSENNCWNWVGHVSKKGYGQFSFMNYPVKPYRLIYTAMYGEIPSGVVIDHLCENRACVNPTHLEATTFKINTLRGTGPAGTNSRKTHCKRGHEFTDKNTRHYNKQRHCRECKHQFNTGGLNYGKA